MIFQAPIQNFLIQLCDYTILHCNWIVNETKRAHDTRKRQHFSLNVSILSHYSIVTFPTIWFFTLSRSFSYFSRFFFLCLLHFSRFLILSSSFLQYFFLLSAFFALSLSYFLSCFSVFTSFYLLFSSLSTSLLTFYLWLYAFSPSFTSLSPSPLTWLTMQSNQFSDFIVRQF